MTDRALHPSAVLLRFLAAAVAGGATGGILISAAIAAFVGSQDGAFGFLDWVPEMLTVLVLFGIAGAVIAIPLVGVPAMLLLRAADGESLPAYAVAGAAGGFLILVCLGGSELPFAGCAGALYGAVTAAWFWFLLRRPAQAG
jgi:hypothetical protein